VDERELIYDWNRAEPAFDWAQARFDLNDETLRDGLQSPSARDPSLDVKKRLLHLMADLGIGAADIGLPGAGPKAVEQVRELAREIRTTGSMSAITVRAAQFGAIGSFESRISLASARTCSTARGPAPGRPMSAATMPRSAMR